MEQTKLRELLTLVASGAVDVEAATERLKSLPYEDLGFAKLDHHRSLRRGQSETIFAQGKTPEQVTAIVTRMREHGSNVLATRCSDETVKAVLAAHSDAVFHQEARCITVVDHQPEPIAGYIGIVCAGTSDIRVAEEAAVSCEFTGNTVERIYDIGVAGLHRLLNHRDILERANALVVCAGMEGALPSVVAGLVTTPVIAVPTSVGYGISAGGYTALMTMLSSCAEGVFVVNIDNGFGAGFNAALINRIANGVS